ncbi:MAG TPA: hypothetical protein VFU22_29550, partial [Roseiflexaceae bacterium]|nr:hypothetical protein [Roseiflexaceae bacterium]
VVNNLAYVVANSSPVHGELWIVDVSKPAAPKLLGSYSTASVTRSVDVLGDRAYLVDDGGLQIVDVHDPANPTALGSFGLTFPNQVYAIGNLAYIPWYRGLQVLDISNPAEIKPIGNYVAPSSIGGVKIVHDGAYVFAIGRMEVYDISNPKQPSWQSSYDARAGWGGADFAGDRAYLPSEYGLQILDVSDPARFVVLSDIPIQGQASFVKSAGDLLYLATYANVQILDVHNPTSPVLLSTYPIGDSRQIIVENNRAYIITQAGLHTLDVSDPAAPTLLGSLAANADSYFQTVKNGLAYLVVAGDIQIVDVHDPAAPVQLGRYPTASAVGDIVWITVHNTVAYIGFPDADYTKFTLQMLDVHEPLSPTLFASYDIADIFGAPMVADDLLYIPGGDAGLQIVRPPIDLVPASATITPAGGQIASADTLALLELPANAVANTITMTYTGLLAPVSTLGAGRGLVRAFSVSGQTSDGAPLDELALPATLTISYTTRMLATHAVSDEASLNLAAWDGQAWQALLPCLGCVHDLEANRITVPITRVSRFALFGKTESMLLPLVRT